MKNMLKLQEFIAQHPDWEKILSDKPYAITISRAKWNNMNLVMFKYSQIDSDFHNSICRECRGLILNEDTMEVMSYPFEKFGNVSEGSWVEKIDWSKKPYVLEKCDGSLIKVVKINGDLLISTNGTILASSAGIAEQIGCESKTFEDLFYYALKAQFKDFSKEWFTGLFEEGYTYMFELCTVFNRVVVPHKEPKTYFIGIRNNKTFEESFIYDHPLSKVFPTPKLYEFDTFEHCIETAKNLPWDSEGYVITSRDFKRNKAKSLGYLSCHHLKNNGVMSYSRGIDLVRLNEVDEVVAYFPEFKQHLDKIREDYNAYIADIYSFEVALKKWITDNGYDAQHWLIEQGGKDRGKIARFIMTTNKELSGFAFALLDGKTESAKAYVDALPSSKLVVALGYKDKE